MKNSWITLREKLIEALNSVLPIIGIVLVLAFTIAPISPSVLLSFLIGAALLIVGMMLFTQGAEMAMVTMGERMGSSMTKTKNLWIIVPLSFFLGFIITISEPDLQVLAHQVLSIPNSILIVAVSLGAGAYLVVALLRMLFSISLPTILMISYGLVFVLAYFVPPSFYGVAFDAGGVTTGPMTVPFIMAMGIGIASIRTDRHAADDSFGLTGLCSIGPVLAVLLLGMVYKPTGSSYELPQIIDVGSSTELWSTFGTGFPVYLKEIAISMLPIIVFFALFQIAVLKITRQNLLRIVVGLGYTYVGLVLFMTGANVGFVPAGNYIGQVIASLPYRWVIVPIGMVIGYFIVKAEPTVYVLNKQVEEITDGAIPGKAMELSLSIGVSASVGLSMIRVLTGINIMWFLLPGYLIAIIFSLFVPKIFTAIAFDSGGIAAGTMSATFLLPLAQGACLAVGGDIVTDAFGLVAMVAMTPLITIQVLGMVYELRKRRSELRLASTTPAMEFEKLDDDSIIDL